MPARLHCPFVAASVGYAGHQERELPMASSRRSRTWVTLLAIVAGGVAPNGAIAQSPNAVSVTPIAPAAALISFRAPGDEYDDCCSSFGYYMVIRGAPGCLREAFPAAYWRGRAEASFEEFGDVKLNGAPPKRGREIREGDTVTIATHAFPACAEPYRGAVIYEQSYDNPDPASRTTVGRFELRVASDGNLAVTGIDLRLVAASGVVLIAAGLCCRWLLRRPT